MSLYTKETDSQRVVFDEYRFIPLLDQENGCQAGCRCGILEYTQLDYLQGGTHEDQEVFFVLSGTGLAVVGDQEIPLSRELTAAGQTGLRLEALAVESRFAELFTDEEINACLERLIEAGYYRI